MNIVNTNTFLMLTTPTSKCGTYVVLYCGKEPTAWNVQRGKLTQLAILLKR